MATLSVEKRYTLEQYLALERPAETRSEYRDGAMIPMGASKRGHALIVGNCLALIGTQLVGRRG